MFEPLPGFGVIADQRRNSEPRGAIKCLVVFTNNGPPDFNWDELCDMHVEEHLPQRICTIEGLGIGTAIELLRRGERMTRRAWLGDGSKIDIKFIQLLTPTYVTAYYESKGLYTWKPVYEDILAQDWSIYSG